jgi:hypothetical protein
MTEIENEKFEVELGPFFTAGVIVLAYGLLRRRKLAIATGLGAIWIDQRTEFGRSVKRRIRTAMKEKIKAHARQGEAEVPGARDDAVSG